MVRRAWELGATNDAWWSSADECFAAWEAAIEESGLGWKYRQVGAGEWDVMEHMVSHGACVGVGVGGRSLMCTVAVCLNTAKRTSGTCWST